MFDDGNIIVRQLDAKKWRLEESLTHRAKLQTFYVPALFETDFASIPLVFVWLIPRYGVYTKAAILHDYLCESDKIDRADADGIFRRSLRELGVSTPRRWMMWAAVRAASRMRGADAGQWFGFLITAPLSILFVAVPAVTVQVFLVIFWLIELAFWTGQRALGREPALPKLRARTA